MNSNKCNNIVSSAPIYATLLNKIKGKLLHSSMAFELQFHNLESLAEHSELK
jgi:hypothetical protein